MWGIRSSGVGIAWLPEQAWLNTILVMFQSPRTRRVCDFQTLLVQGPFEKVLLPRLFWGNIRKKSWKPKKIFAKKQKIMVNSTPSILQTHGKFYYSHFIDQKMMVNSTPSIFWYKKCWQILLLPFFDKKVMVNSTPFIFFCGKIVGFSSWYPY